MRIYLIRYMTGGEILIWKENIIEDITGSSQ